MDDKSSPQQGMSRTVRRLRPTAILLFIIAICYAFWQWESFALPGDFVLDGQQGHSSQHSAGLVPLEAHIISKCPDTREALRQLILPVMQRVYDKVDFKLSYIGKTTANDGVDCMHGPSECMGNIIELCARELYPDPKINLGFIMCLTRDYTHIPERTLVEDCALEHAIDIQALNDCAAADDGAHGLELLRNSVERSAKSPKNLPLTGAVGRRVDQLHGAPQQRGLLRPRRRPVGRLPQRLQRQRLGHCH